MEFPKQSLSLTPVPKVKGTAGSQEQVQQATYSQKRYVTVLDPKSTGQPSQPDSKLPTPPLPLRSLQRNEARLPRPLSTTPPRSQSRYMTMLLELDEIPRRHNFYASVYTWLILAGYIVFPGTFTSLKSSDSVQEAASRTQTGKVILDTVQNAPLLWVAGACCLFGVVGISSLWRRWKTNYIWLVNRIFL